MRTYDFGHWKSPFVIEWHKDAGGSRTHFDRVAAGCRAVWLQRLNSLAAYRETETPSQAEAVGLEPTKRYFRGAKGDISCLTVPKLGEEDSNLRRLVQSQEAYP